MKNPSFLVSTLVFLALTHSSISQEPEFGSPCIGVSRCSKTSGLICGPESTCICTHGTLTSSLRYNLAWNPTLKKCFGEFGSGCIGTQDHPATSNVECAAGLTCLQVSGLPNGIGNCEIAPAKAPAPISYGQPCNSLTNCDKAAGLICGADFNCTCSNGPVNENLTFAFEWNTTRNKCLASIDSACVSTIQTPTVAESVVECVSEAVCTEPTDVLLPPGVGICMGEVSKPPTDAGFITTCANTLIFFSLTLLVLQ